VTGLWECVLPRAEAIGLTSESGPLQVTGEPGVIIWEGGEKVTLDDSAFDSLRHLGHLSNSRDGRITFDGETPCLTFGHGERDRYPVFRVLEDVPASG
jgi:hypothetical protein